MSIIDDEKATDVQASVTVGDDVIDISNNLITVNKYGSASITITYKNADLKSVEKKIDILVQRPIAEYDESINFSIKDGYIPVTTIWGNEVTIKEAYVGTPLLKGEEISIEDGKVVEGISLNGNKSEQKTITLLTETEGYIVDIDVYTHLIDDANDLVETFNLTDKDITGAFLVTQDIDASDLGAIKHNDFYNAESGSGAKKGFDYAFKGTFDGAGHTIKVNVENCGLFGILKNATITNANFVLNISGITNGLGYNPTGLAYHAIDTTITDVYAELNVATGLTNASGRTWALSLISNIPTLNDGYIMMQNVVVVNNDDFANLNANTEKHWVGGALFYNDNGRKSAASRAESIKNVFVIAPEQLGNGYYIPMAGGTVQQVFANNDAIGKENATEKTGQTQYLYDYVTRYATMESMYQNVDLDSLPTSLASKIIKDTLIIEVNGNAVNGGVELESGEWNTITLKAGETSLSDLQLHSSDDSIVIIDGTSIKMVGFGVATITATGKVFGIEITQTFSVVMTVETYEQEQLFSGLDGEVDMQTIFGEQAVLLNAYGTDGVAYTVVNGKIADLTNDTNEALTKTLILETTTHKFKKATFKVYTKILDDASDLAVLSLTKDTVKNITGCFLVTKDIDATNLTANQHTDIREGDWNFNYAFTGTFDGNGHTIKANADKGGLFGVLNGATITNANFVLNITGSARVNTDKMPVGLAYEAKSSKISNVYAQLNVGTGLSTANRTWALALITNTDKTLEMENVVVVNNDDFSKITPNSANWIGGALFYTDGSRLDIASHNAKMKNVFVIAPERMSDSGLYVPMAGGTKVQVFANNDTVGAADAKNKTSVDQAVYTKVTRYNTVSDFVKGFVWENNIPDFIMEDLLVSGTTAYVGETPLQNNAEIKLPLNVAKTVTLKIGAKELINVELSSNDDCVTISGNSFTLTKVGTANVTATGEYKYTTKDNVDKYMTVTFNFTVSLNSTTYEEKVLFSGMDGDVDVKTIFGEGAVLANAFDSDGNVLTVTDGKISGLTNTTNAPIEKTLLLGTSANEWKYVTFTVYTKLLDDANDLKVFELTTHNVTGCYLVTKDIDASAEKAIAHTDITMLESGQTSRDFDYKFAGVFDGGNHTVEVNVSNCGLFGRLQDSTISNVNFIFNISGAAIGGNYIPTGLAYEVLQGAASQGTTKISNVYVELNVATGLTVASNRTWALALMQNGSKHVILEKVVVVNNDDFENLKPNGWVAGALFYVDAGRTDSGIRTQYRKNVFVIAPERLGKADDGTGNPTANYAYYVSMSGGTAIQVFASNDTAGVEAAKVNTGNTTQYTYANVTRYSDAKTFVDSNAWSGIISDSVMNAVRLNNVTE